MFGWIFEPSNLVLGYCLVLLAQAKRLTNRKFDLSLTQLLVKAVGQFGSA